MLTHTVEVDGARDLRVLCTSVDINSLADACAGDPSVKPTCRVCARHDPRSIRLTETQRRALRLIAEDGNADGVYATASGPTPGMARHNADGTMEALRRRGLVVDDGAWQLTDAGHAAAAALAFSPGLAS